MSRVDGVLYTEHTARVRHMCSACQDPIEPGERYVKAALPPLVDPNHDPRWWTMKVHGRSLYDCPTYQPALPADPVASAVVERMP